MAQHFDDVELFGQMFATLAHGMFQNFDLAELQLTPQQVMTLIMVYAHPGNTMSQLADLLGTTAPQLTRTIRALEARDLVTRRHNPDNRREVNVFRTKAGDAVAEAHMRHVQSRIESRLSGLSNTDRQRLTADLRDGIHILAKVGIVQMPKPDQLPEA